MVAMTVPAVRQTLGYGQVFEGRPDPQMTRRWIEPALKSQAICNDAAKVLRAMRPETTLDAATRFGRFTKPVHVVWGDSDTFFPLEVAERLVAAFPDASLTTISGARTFVSMDHPEDVAKAIASASRQGA